MEGVKMENYYKNYCLKNKEKLSLKKQEYYEKNKEKISLYAKKHYQKNKGKKQTYNKKYREENKEKFIGYREKNKEKLNLRALKILYGITLLEYNKILESQNGVCAICKNTESIIDNRTNKIRNLAVDHDHKTNKIRGLLCVRCNLLLGKAQDKIELLNNAINYLKQNEVIE